MNSLLFLHILIHGFLQHAYIMGKKRLLEVCLHIYKKRSNYAKIIWGKKKGKQKKKRRETCQKMLKTNAEDSETSDENICIVCMKPFGNSKAKEVWVKCILCSLWARQACIPGLPTFVNIVNLHTFFVFSQ